MELLHNHERIINLISIENGITTLLQLKDVLITEFESTPNENHIYLEMPRKSHHCPACNTITDTIHDYRVQPVLDCPIYHRKTLLFYRKRRYRCPCCGKRFFEFNTFLPLYSHTTNRLTFKLFEALHSVSSQKDISTLFSISSMRVRRLLDQIKPGLPDLPEILGIDEFKGNTNQTKFHCILTDLQSHKPIDIFPNRTEAALIHHFRKYQYTNQLKRVKIIVIDMWRSYYTVLRFIFPDAIILIDCFHMVRQAM